MPAPALFFILPIAVIGIATVFYIMNKDNCLSITACGRGKTYSQSSPPRKDNDDNDDKRKGGKSSSTKAKESDDESFVYDDDDDEIDDGYDDGSSIETDDEKARLTFIRQPDSTTRQRNKSSGTKTGVKSAPQSLNHPPPPQFPVQYYVSNDNAHGHPQYPSQKHQMFNIPSQYPYPPYPYYTPPPPNCSHKCYCQRRSRRCARPSPRSAGCNLNMSVVNESSTGSDFTEGALFDPSEDTSRSDGTFTSSSSSSTQSDSSIGSGGSGTYSQHSDRSNRSQMECSQCHERGASVPIVKLKPCGHSKTCKNCIEDVLQGSQRCPTCDTLIRSYRRKI